MTITAALEGISADTVEETTAEFQAYPAGFEQLRRTTPERVEAFECES